MMPKTDIAKSSGNVLADIDLPAPETALAKAELARRINAIIKQRGIKQADVAKLLGIDQANLSALSRGRLAGFSTERLFRFLNELGRDVQIVIDATPASRKRGRISILGGA